jgi:hypothetical protein
VSLILTDILDLCEDPNRHVEATPMLSFLRRKPVPSYKNRRKPISFNPTVAKGDALPQRQRTYYINDFKQLAGVRELHCKVTTFISLLFLVILPAWARVHFRRIEDATRKYVFGILSAVGILVNGPGEARADYMQTILSDMPAVYYRLGEASGSTAFDTSANHRNGSYLGGVSLGQPGALVGDPNTSVTFNGSTGIVDTNYKQGDLSFTFEAWINPTAAIAKEWAIAGRGSGTSLNYNAWDGFSQPIHATPGHAGIALFDGTAFDVSLTKGVLPLNQWTYVAGTWDNSTKNLDIYLNGTLDNMKVFAGKTPVYSDPLSTFQIGAINTGLHGSTPPFNNEYFNGGIDEVAYYSSALTADEIKEHYLAGITAANAVPEPGTLTLAGLGIAGILGYGWPRRKPAA